MKTHKLIYKELACLFIFCWILVICSCQSKERNLSVLTIKADITSNAELKLSEYLENFRMLKLPTDVVKCDEKTIKQQTHQIPRLLPMLFR